MKAVTLLDYKQRMIRVLVYIQQNLDEPLRLDDVAGRAYFSPYHFHRIFTGMMGESLKGHIRRLRLERAASQLKSSHQPVTQIAFGAGYETHEAFSRAFKSTFGIAPIAFRSLNSHRLTAAATSGVHYREGEPPKNFKTIRYGGQKMDVKIKSIKPIRVAFLRHVGPYAACGATWDKFLPSLGSKGILGSDTQFIGICHDDPEVTPPDKVRYDACVSVDDPFMPEGEVGVQTISGGEYAVTTHCGSYDQLGKTYARLMGEWLPRSGRELRASPCFEIYLNNPENTDPEDLITDIYAPLTSKKKSTQKGERS